MATLFTRADYDLLPESYPAQLIEGALVCEPCPAFGHQRLALSIAEILKRLVGGRRVGIAPVDVHVDEFNIYQPDVVVFREPLADDVEWDKVAPPLLVVEVLSPSTQRHDRLAKRVRLLDAGVVEVWLVDREDRSIEVYDRDRHPHTPRRAVGTSAVRSAALPGFALTPRDLFGA